MRLLPLFLIATFCLGCAAERRDSLASTVVVGAPLTVEQWRQIFEDAKATPGAEVDTTGRLLASVLIASPPERRAMYLFTQPAHPAHPAFVMAVPSAASNESTMLKGGYAGSKEEFEKFFNQLLAATSSSVPHTVDEAVQVLRTRLSGSDLDWILRTPRDEAITRLHLPFGTHVRNEFRLWGGNPELLQSCGVADPEECSGIIFERLWEAVREDADPSLVRRLDCQFALAASIQVRYADFYRLRVGEVFERLQEQIDKQLPTLRSHMAAACDTSLSLRPVGEPKLRCWSRAEFSEDGADPVSLERFLGWYGWRNGFSAVHAPPFIEARFYEKCAWPSRPDHFRPERKRD